MRQDIRRHPAASGHELCWQHPNLWGLLPETTDPVLTVPDWPQFLEGCIRYRRSRDTQASAAPRTSEPLRCRGHSWITCFELVFCPRHANTIDVSSCLSAPSIAMPPTTAITIHVPRVLRAYCDGAAELFLPAASVRATLDELERRHPALYRSICDETGKVRRHVNLFVNSSHVRERDGLETVLAPRDVLTIVPAVSGG